MAQLLLVNPRKRRKAKAKRKSNPTPKRRRKSAVKRRRNPIVSANPIRKYRRKARSSNPIKRRRRNPIGGKFRLNGLMNSTIKPAAMGALGALGLDAIFGYGAGFIPASLTTGPQKHLAKGLAAVAIGLIASKVIKRKSADEMALGAMTVVLHDAARELVTNYAPGVKLGYYMDSSPMDGIAYYPPEYAQSVPNQTQIGYYPSDNSWANQVNSQMNAFSYSN